MDPNQNILHLIYIYVNPRKIFRKSDNWFSRYWFSFQQPKQKICDDHNFVFDPNFLNLFWSELINVSYFVRNALFCKISEIKKKPSHCNCYKGLENNFWAFNFFFKIFLFIHMKELVEKGPEIGVRGLKVNPRLLRNSCRSKNGPKIAKLFRWFLTMLFELLFQNWFKFLTRSFPIVSRYFFSSKFRNLRILYQK